MKQTRKLKRRRKRRLKKGFKILFLSIPVIAALVLIVIFGFQMKTVTVSLDLNQFTQDEVKGYLDSRGINNTLIFWLKNKVGMSENLDLFEEYSVKLLSPSKIRIDGYERELKGYINDNKMYCYFDQNGEILKISSEKLKNIPRLVGLKYNKISLYQKIEAENDKVLTSLLTVVNAIEPYNYKIKKIAVNDEAETSVYIEKLQINLGKTTNLDKKLKDFNDMYDKVIGYDGVLNMKHASEDSSYTIKKNESKPK